MFPIYFLIVCSLVMLAWAAGTIFWRYKYDSKLRLKKNFIAIVQLFMAVFFLIGAGVCMLNTSPEKLNGPDSFVKVLSYTFQLFTLDETFETSMEWMYLIKNDFFRGLYTFLSVLYSVLVPFAGGFIIFNLLSSIVPRFRLLVNSFKSAKFVFSELNERSITLAEDIAKQSWLAHRHMLEENKEDEVWLKSCLFIFLNVDRDNVDREFYDRASRIGAICMNDDILERGFSFFTFFPTKIVYFMMDTNPWSNLNSAVSLLSTKRELWKRTVTQHEQGEKFEDGAEMPRPKISPFKTDNMNMYVFTENPDAGKLLEDAFGYNCERCKIQDGKDKKVVIAKCDSDITVFVVNEYKNLVYKLLLDNEGTMLLGNLEAADEKKSTVSTAKAEEPEDKTETNASEVKSAAPQVVQSAPGTAEVSAAELATGENAVSEKEPVSGNNVLSDDGTASDNTLSSVIPFVADMGHAPKMPEILPEAAADIIPLSEIARKDAEKKAKDKRVRIAIFGGGKIAKEFLKTVAWCSQMLDPDNIAPTPDKKGYKRVQVEIDLLSDNAKDFEQEMRHSCPAIFGEERWDGRNFGKKLRHKSETFDDTQRTKYIDEISFDEAAFGTEDFEVLFNKHDLYDSDVFLIALGDDDLNLRAASWTRKKLLQKHGAKKISLYFAIEDDALCATLRSRSDTFLGRDIVEMIPFGALAERFSYSNIVRPHIERLAREIDNIHSGRRNMRAYISNYNFESSTASALHGPFRKYSTKHQTQLDQSTVQRLYWLEHRRWSAYIASLGVVYPTAKSFFEHKKAKGSFATHNLTDSGWHSCLTDSYAAYVDPKDIIIKIIRAYGVEMKPRIKADGKLQSGYDAAIEMGDLLKIDCIRANEADVRDGEFLGEYIDRWFNNVTERVPSIDASKLDPLDKLSVFLTIQNCKKVDLKEWDIKIAKNTFLYSTQQALLEVLGHRRLKKESDGEMKERTTRRGRIVGKKEKITRLVNEFLNEKFAVDNFSGSVIKTEDTSDESEARPEELQAVKAADAETAASEHGDEDNKSSNKKQSDIDVKLTSYIVSVDDGDYLLLEGASVTDLISQKDKKDKDASLGSKEETEEAKCEEGKDGKDASSKKRVRWDVIPIGKDKLLVKVPLKGKVCIGYAQKLKEGGKPDGDKKRYPIYMFQETLDPRDNKLKEACDYIKPASACDNKPNYYICCDKDGFSKEKSWDLETDNDYKDPSALSDKKSKKTAKKEEGETGKGSDGDKGAKTGKDNKKSGAEGKDASKK